MNTNNNKQGIVWAPYILLSEPKSSGLLHSYVPKKKISTRYSYNYEEERRRKILEQRKENINELLNG